MFPGMKWLRPKPRSASRCEARLVIEPLEGRESPSTLRLDSSLSVDSFAGPLALGLPAVDPMPQAAWGQQAAPPVAWGVAGAPLVPTASSSAPAAPSAETYAFGTGNESSLLFDQGNRNDNAPGPVISEFHASEGERGWWTFWGVVVADNPWGLTMRLGGLPSLQGQTTEVQSDGTFRLTIRLHNGEEGLATAQTTDWQGRDSNVAQDYVHQSNGVGGVQP
jgi:hypothetical protein